MKQAEAVTKIAPPGSTLPAGKMSRYALRPKSSISLASPWVLGANINASSMEDGGLQFLQGSQDVH